jgi:hypothetical protein
MASAVQPDRFEKPRLRGEPVHHSAKMRANRRPIAEALYGVLTDQSWQRLAPEQHDQG